MGTAAREQLPLIINGNQAPSDMRHFVDVLR